MKLNTTQLVTIVVGTVLGTIAVAQLRNVSALRRLFG